MKHGIQNDAEKRYYHRTQESLKRKKKSTYETKSFKMVERYTL